MQGERGWREGAEGSGQHGQGVMIYFGVEIYTYSKVRWVIHSVSQALKLIFFIEHNP